jgi:hypothetical protein
LARLIRTRKKPSSLQCQHSDSESSFIQVSPDIPKPPEAGKHQNPVYGLQRAVKTKILPRIIFDATTCKPSHAGDFHWSCFSKPPWLQLGFPQPLAPFGRFALSQPHSISSQALPRLRQVCSLFPLWLSPRPVTHRHVTRARPTSPGTPRPFNCTRPSASLSALHLPIGSGHCPAARSWTLGPLTHARRTPLFLRLRPAPLPDSDSELRVGSCDMGPGTQPATHRSPFGSARRLSQTRRPRPGNLRQATPPHAERTRSRRCCFTPC